MSRPTEASPRPHAVLQLGLHWFTQRAGGLDRYVAGLTTHRPPDWDVRLLALRASDVDAGVPEFVRFYARSTDSPLQRRKAFRRAFDEALAERKVNVIASHFAQVSHPLRGRPSADVPHIVHFHGPWAAESKREGAGRLSVFAKRWIERAVYARADRLICLSSVFAKVLIEEYGVDPTRVLVIPGGVDADAFDPPATRAEAREQLGWEKDRPTVVCVRRLVRRMGLETLIAAADQVRKAVPDIAVKICGKGPLAEELNERVRRAGLERHVTLCGFVPDRELPLVYRAADVSIVPTESLEGFGLTTLESLAAGTPCLVTPVGGLPEAVSGLSNQLVITGTGEAALARSLREAMGGTLKLPAAADCQRYVRMGFHWPIIAAQIHHAYLNAHQQC